MEYRGAHQAFSKRWKATDNDLCKHSMSFVLHKTLRNEFFASYLYLLEQMPLDISILRKTKMIENITPQGEMNILQFYACIIVKLYPVTCEYIDGEKQFYSRAQNFYKDVEPSEEGIMGDFVELSPIDIEGSRQFLKKFVGGPGKAGTQRALDCGCGIGRVTKNVLLPVFETMDMADMIEEFLLHAHEHYLGSDNERIEVYYCYSLQELTPPVKKYDVIWMQWVACHLTDKDLMVFLIKAKASLKPNGVIIIKDNMARQGCKLDRVDSSIIRHLDIMKCIITKAGLDIIGVEKQEGFPEQMVPIWMIAMQ